MNTRLRLQDPRETNPCVVGLSSLMSQAGPVGARMVRLLPQMRAAFPRAVPGLPSGLLAPPGRLGLDATRPLRTQAGRVSVSWLPRGSTQAPSHSGQTLSGPHCLLHISTLLPLPPGAPQLVPVTWPGPTAGSEEWSGESQTLGVTLSPPQGPRQGFTQRLVQNTNSNLQTVTWETI